MKPEPTKLPATNQDRAALNLAPAGGLNHFRQLEWNELVTRGDFVADGHEGFELWEGPSGFRADAFVKTIYRRGERRPASVKKKP